MTTGARQRVWLLVGVAITVLAHVFPEWLYSATWVHFPRALKAAGPSNWYDVCALAYGLLLTLPCPRRSGLHFGQIAGRRCRVALACGLPVLAAAVVYPQLPVRPFAGSSVGMWLISPLAQDLVFMGFLYSRYETVFPGHIHPKVPIARALVLAALFFSMWHLVNLGRVPAPYLLFQLAYTFAGGVITGLARQWTGSVLYTAAAHMAVNWIAWAAG